MSQTPDAPEGVYTPEQIAAALTEARKRLILALPADGSWGAAPCRKVAKRLWWNFGYGLVPHLIDHKHCPEDRNEWRLTKAGIRVRAAITRATSTIADGRVG